LVLESNQTALYIRHIGHPFSMDDLQLSTSFLLVESLTDQIEGDFDLKVIENGCYFLLKFKT